jgi:MFS family permease
MTKTHVKAWFGKHTILPLCAAGVLMAVAASIFLIAVPFVVKRLGGSDGTVGVTLSLNFTAYLAACLALSPILDRFNSKRLVQVGIVGVTLSTLGLFLTLLWAKELSRPIWIVNLFSALIGIFSASYWPPMMGWISRGFEGKELSHRLGSYNMSWSTGNWISPYLGGVLVSINSGLPIIVSCCVAASCLAVVSWSRNPRRDVGQTVINTGEPKFEFNKNLPLFQWMARFALVSSFLCVGLVRSQLGLFFKFQLGYSESAYGIAVMAMTLGNFLMFWAMGRWHGWHYGLWKFLGAQLFLSLSMLLILGFTSLWILVAATGIIGIAEAFIYASHLFYNVSGAKSRSGLMALHEFLLSVGLVIGSLAGGYVSDAFGRYMPYWFGLLAVLAAMALQGIIGAVIKKTVTI